MHVPGLLSSPPIFQEFRTIEANFFSNFNLLCLTRIRSADTATLTYSQKYDMKQDMSIYKLVTYVGHCVLSDDFKSSFLWLNFYKGTWMEGAQMLRIT